MDEMIQLLAGDMGLRFEPAEGSIVCGIHLQQGDRGAYLGDQSGRTIRESLLALLERRVGSKLTRHDDGKYWGWLFNTAEPYHFVYGRVSGAEFELKLWNGSAEQLTAQLQISDREAEQWLAALEYWKRRDEEIR